MFITNEICKKNHKLNLYISWKERLFRLNLYHDGCMLVCLWVCVFYLVFFLVSVLTVSNCLLLCILTWRHFCIYFNATCGSKLAGAFGLSGFQTIPFVCSCACTDITANVSFLKIYLNLEISNITSNNH